MAWFHDNRRVTSCDGLSISQEGGVSVLRIDELDPLDAGEWRVLAINAYGQAVSLCRIAALGQSHCSMTVGQSPCYDLVQCIDDACS